MRFLIRDRITVKHAVDIFLNYYGTQDKEGPNKRKPSSSRPRRKRQSPLTKSHPHFFMHGSSAQILECVPMPET